MVQGQMRENESGKTVGYHSSLPWKSALDVLAFDWAWTTITGPVRKYT